MNPFTAYKNVSASVRIAIILSTWPEYSLAPGAEVVTTDQTLALKSAFTRSATPAHNNKGMKKLNSCFKETFLKQKKIRRVTANARTTPRVLW